MNACIEIQYQEYLTAAATVCRSHSHRATTGKKQKTKTVLLNTSHCQPALSLVPVKTQISHKTRQRVRWWGQDNFSSSLCNHSEALSQSENLSEYSASQQPSQRQQRLKLPSSLLALHLSSLSEKPSWGISAQRALTPSVSDASWPIRKNLLEYSCTWSKLCCKLQVLQRALQGQKQSCWVTVRAHDLMRSGPLAPKHFSKVRWLLPITWTCLRKYQVFAELRNEPRNELCLYNEGSVLFHVVCVSGSDAARVSGGMPASCSLQMMLIETEQEWSVLMWKPLLCLCLLSLTLVNWMRVC